MSRSRHAARRPTQRGEAFFHLCDDELPTRADRDWLGAVVLATALVVGTGLVMLIQLTPALRHAVG